MEKDTSGKMNFLETLKTSSSTITGSIGLGLCLCALEAWRFPVVDTSGAEAWQYSTLQTAPKIANFLAIVALILLILQYGFSKRKLLRRSVSAVVFACAMSISLYAYFSYPDAASNNIFMYIVSQVFMAFGVILLAIWIEELCNKRDQAVAIMVLSFFFSSAIQASIGLIIAPVAKGTCALLPVMSMLLLLIHRRQDAPFFKLSRQDQQKAKRNTAQERQQPIMHNLVLTGMGMLLYGFLFSNLHSTWYFAELGNWSSMLIQLASALGALLAGLVLACAFPSLKSGLLEVVILVFTLFALYFSTFDEKSIVTVFYLTPLNAAQKAVFLLLLTTCLTMLSIKRSMLMFCSLFLCYRIGLSVKKVVDTASPISQDSLLQSLLFVIAIAALVSCALYALTHPSDSTNNQNKPAVCGDEQQIIEHYKEFAFYFFLAQEHNLTQREVEILPLILEMKNASGIADDLVITQATAKSHLRNIYAKLDVHSQQEAIDLMMIERKKFM